MLTICGIVYSAWTANTLGISGTANLILAVLIVGGYSFHVQEDVPCSSVYHCICCHSCDTFTDHLRLEGKWKSTKIILNTCRKIEKVRMVKGVSVPETDDKFMAKYLAEAEYILRHLENRRSKASGDAASGRNTPLSSRRDKDLG